MEDTVVYVNAQGAKLTRIGERLVVRSHDGKILTDVPFFRVTQVVCMGSVESSHSATVALLRRGIDIAYLTLDGRFKCRLSNLLPRAVECRRKQYERACNPEWRLKISRSVVKGKLTNSRVWLMRQNRSRDEALTSQILGVKNCLDAVETAGTNDELMGIEGTAARYHFEGIRLILKQDMGFAGRVRRPPTDPVNAMLSFGYTLLYNRVLSALEQAGLDPMLSNLHAIEDRRASLSLDLMEEYRTLLIDSVVVSLINRMELTSADFTTEPGKGVRMSEKALGKLIKNWQDRLNEEVRHPVRQKMYSYKDIILQQVYQYKSVVMGESADYQPITTR